MILSKRNMIVSVLKLSSLPILLANAEAQSSQLQIN